MDPIEQRVRQSLRARAEDAEPTPHLYRGVQDRISRRQRLRVVAWSLAGVAAVAAAVVVVVPNLVAGVDTRTLEIADTPESTEEDPAAPAVPGEPTHTLLGLEDGSIVLADLQGRDRQAVWGGAGRRITAISAAPGSTLERYRAVVTTTAEAEDEALLTLLWQEGDTGGAAVASTVNLPGGTGQTPSVAISPDGEFLAYTGISQTVDAAPAVYVAPIAEDSDGALDVALDAFEEVYTVTSGDPSGAIVDLVQWVGPTDVGRESHLHVLGEDGQGAIVLERGDEGFEVQQRGTFDGVSRDALDLSNAFVAADPIEDPVFLLERDEDGLPAVRFEDAVASTDMLGVDPEEVALDARGRTALLVGGGTAITVHFDGSDDGVSASFSPTIDGVTAGALLGGRTRPPPEEDDAPTPEDEPGGGGELGDGLVVADDATVTLVRPDGSTQELVSFPAEGESTVVDVAVRPGSTAEDLTVAITTRAEGTFDVRWLQVGDGEVDTTIDPVGTEFPAPPVTGANGFPLAAPDLQDGGEPAAVWSPDGDLLAVVVRPARGAPNEVRTIGWTDDGPSEDPNLAATFALGTDRPLTPRQWVWTDEADGAAREGELLVVDELAREAFTLRLDRQADGAPAMPPQNPLVPVEGAGVLDLADTDGDGVIDTVLSAGDGVPILQRRGPRGFEVAIDAAGPRDVSFLAALPDTILVVLDPGQPVLLDPTTGQMQPAPIEGEVVSADLLRSADPDGG